MAIIQSGAGATLQTIDPTSNAGRVSIYDSSGNILSTVDRAAVTVGASSTGGIIVMGKDYKIARAVRVGPWGSIRTSDESILLYDAIEGAAVDTNKWVQTLTGAQTITQAAATGITFNSSALTTINTASMHVSHRQFPKIPRTPLIFRQRLRNTLVANQIGEFGFGSPSGVTALVPNGAFFRFKSDLTLVGVISSNNVETESSTITVPASTDNCVYEIFYDDDRVGFQVWKSNGVLLGQAYAEVPTTNAMAISVSHIPAFNRVWNVGTPGSGGQLIVSNTCVLACDNMSQRDWLTTMSGMSYNSSTSPTAYTQLAKSVNNTAASSITLSNTAVTGGTNDTLGGHLRATAMVGSIASPADSIMFGWQNPGPHTFYFTGIRIACPMNQVVAVATTDTILTYILAFNSSAISLATAAPYTPMRKVLSGSHSAIIALAANKMFTGTGAATNAPCPDIIWQPKEPIPVFPTRFLHVILRCMLGTATATEIYEWPGVDIDGFFE